MTDQRVGREEEQRLTELEAREDSEVEKLARFLAGIYSRVGWDSIMAAEKGVYRRDADAVLAHLRERYVFVPRADTEVRQEWTNSRRDYPVDTAQAWTDEEHADSLRSQWNYVAERADASKGTPPRRPLRKFTRTTTVHHTRWEPVP